MKEFTVNLKYLGINNYQACAKEGTVTGMDNVKVLQKVTRLSDGAITDLANMIDKYSEEEVRTHIEWRFNEIFTAVSALMSSKKARLDKIEHQKFTKAALDYFDWETIEYDPKFPYEEEDIDWDCNYTVVLQQLYPKKYSEFVKNYNLNKQ